ncbi:MAG TPA: pilus assembly protein PilM [Candidatus Acidoferrum sp.]|nr:pilus assembly protein PilM [Candidatus Acidoferrum sp.]
MPDVNEHTSPAQVSGAKPQLRPATSGPTGEAVIRSKERYRWGSEVSFVVDQTGIQMASVSCLGRRCTLQDTRKIYFPAKALADQDRNAFIMQTVSEYLQKHGGGRAQLSLGISGPSTVFRTFTMPALSRNSLESAIRFEARKQVPFPAADCQYSYRPVSRIERDGATRVRIALHAATKVFIQEQIAPFESAGMNVGTIIHAPEALGHLLKKLPEYSEEQHFTLLNIERTRSELAYYRGSELEFYHVCTLGSSFISDRTDPTVFEYFAESLAGEIQNSLDYYAGHVSGQHANRIYIYGDLAYTEELISLMSDHFGFEFRRFPGEDLDLGAKDIETVQSSLAVCLPAVAAAICPIHAADLLPHANRQHLRVTKANRWSLFGLLAISALLTVLWLVQVSERASGQQKFNNLTGQIEEFRSSKLYDTYNLLKRQVARERIYLQNAKPPVSRFSLMLKELSNLTPDGVHLNQLNFDTGLPDQNLQILGAATSTTVPPEVLLAEFVENLKASPVFRDVTVVRYDKRTVGSGFELGFELSGKGCK